MCVASMLCVPFFHDGQKRSDTSDICSMNAGPSWSRLKWIANTWRDAVRLWLKKIEGCKRKCKSLGHWSYLHNSTCKWILPPLLQCALRASVLPYHLHPPRQQLHPLLQLQLTATRQARVFSGQYLSTLGQQCLVKTVLGHEFSPMILAVG
jgi:hypothetical protein